MSNQELCAEEQPTGMQSLLNALRTPRIDNARVMKILSAMYNEYLQGNFSLCELSVTKNTPSVLRGAKDLSDWGLNYRVVSSILKPKLEAIWGDFAEGAIAVCIAELLYEQNDIAGASLEAAAIAKDNVPVEIEFAGLALLARLACVEASSNAPVQILEHIRKLITEKQADNLTKSLQALEMRFAIQRGQTDAAKEWIENDSSNDFEAFSENDIYQKITKAKAYMAIGSYHDAMVLLERMVVSLDNAYRPLDLIECLCLVAICCETLESYDNALDKLEKALLLASQYRYIRVIADQGKPIFHLLIRYQKEHRGMVSEAYLRHVIDAAGTFSALFPKLYEYTVVKSCDKNFGLTPTELQILQLLSDGLTNQDIGSKLKIKLPTVKFHVTNVMSKLDAKNRSTAVKLGKDTGII